MCTRAPPGRAPPGRQKPWLPAALAARLVDYDWPGNIRQLRNVVEKLVSGSRGRDRLELTPAIERLISGRDRLELTSARQARSATLRRAESGVTEDELAEALRASQWSLAAAARKLNMSRQALYMLLKRYPRVRRLEPTPEEILRCYRECAGDVKRMVEKLQVSESSLSLWLLKLGLK